MRRRESTLFSLNLKSLLRWGLVLPVVVVVVVIITLLGKGPTRERGRG